MEGADRVDDRTFKADFTVDGLSKLRDRVTDKLKEFMGEYTDDTLVEYVIVLLKNGRRKEEAKSELDVFLDDDSDSFVAWLWDHLGSNLHLYVQPSEPHTEVAADTKHGAGEQTREIVSRHLDSEPEKEKFSDLSKRRHNREWKGLVRDGNEPPPLRSSVNNKITRTEEVAHHKVDHAKRSSSPQPTYQRKRSRPYERDDTKRGGVGSQTKIDAPRRLLQFAVRDAMATLRPSSLSTEPSQKRLRSVVSMSTEDSPVEAKKTRPVARVPMMAAAIKAVAEAAKDVSKVRSSRNVFDRLGHGIAVSKIKNEVAEFSDVAVEDGQYEDHEEIHEETHASYYQRKDTDMSFDSASDNGDVNALDRVDASHTGTITGNAGDGSLTVQYSVAKNANKVIREPWEGQDQSVGVPNTSRKIVNISVNVNTWKPPHQYQEPREILELRDNEVGSAKSGEQVMKENNVHVAVSNGNAKAAVDAQRDSQKTVPSGIGYATGRLTEDADSRTIFVNNVHFAATKDSLSRHFNKFGEVRKVVILTDAATGQPKGSTYIEFMRKEAAENALSLDGTSFMSRMLKVVKKSSAPQETASAVSSWPPRIARGSPFGGRFSRAPFARGGVPSLYRPRVAMRPLGGARSLQWKRDATENTATATTPTSGVARSLTYVRPTEPAKTGSASGAGN